MPVHLGIGPWHDFLRLANLSAKGVAILHDDMQRAIGTERSPADLTGPEVVEGLTKAEFVSINPLLQSCLDVYRRWQNTPGMRLSEASAVLFHEGDKSRGDRTFRENIEGEYRDYANQIHQATGDDGLLRLLDALQGLGEFVDDEDAEDAMLRSAEEIAKIDHGSLDHVRRDFAPFGYPMRLIGGAAYCFAFLDKLRFAKGPGRLSGFNINIEN